MDAALRAVAEGGPSAVSGRAIARDAEVHHAQIQQMFGSVDVLVTDAVMGSRDRFVRAVLRDLPDGPDPLAVASYPTFWRAMTQVVLDPGPIPMTQLAADGPIAQLTERLDRQAPGRDTAMNEAIASAWVAAPLGALIFEAPLCRGLGIAENEWHYCWEHLGERLRALAEVSTLPDVGPEEPPRAAHLRSPAAPAHGRDRLVAAAEGLLATRLETGISGRELASFAEVNYGLVNHYFGSKAAVFDEALLNLHQHFIDDLLEPGHRRLEVGAHELLLRHRAFLRAWASRLLGQRQVPDFELVGMRMIAAHILERRAIDPSDVIGARDAVADAMAALTLQLGWVLLRPLHFSTDTQASTVTHALYRVNRWLLEPQPFG